MADTVSSITGLSLEEAASFLEMAGGNAEAAVALYFDMGSGPAAATTSSTPSSTPPQSPCHSVLFGSAAAPASWLDQGFEFSSDPQSRCGLVQHKNGPCGVLAAVNAEVISLLVRPVPSKVIDPGMLCAALGAILLRCASGGRVTLAKWTDLVGGALSEETFVADSAGTVAEILLPRAKTLMGRGGCCLFCYSCVLTRGIEAVRSDTALDNGTTPLIVGPNALCATELMNLLLAGVARGNVGAYGADGKKVTWRTRGRVGLLSRDEFESGMPLADELKSPTQPVFVLHGGDHFTVAWVPASPQVRIEARVRAIFAEKTKGSAGAADPNGAAAEAFAEAAAEFKGELPTPQPPADAFDIALWNGLSPNRNLGWLRLRGSGDPLAEAPPAPDAHQPSQWRLTVGEVESIVQASPQDKKDAPGRWCLHAYEISLVTQTVADEDASDVRPDSVPPPTRLDPAPPPAEGAAWRCASCYNTRFKTMCFGENPPGNPACRFCSLAPAVAGWTVWRKYATLPPGLQKRIDRTTGPKVLGLLRTRWPEASVSAIGENGAAEAELGTASFDLSAFTVAVV